VEHRDINKEAMEHIDRSIKQWNTDINIEEMEHIDRSIKQWNTEIKIVTCKEHRDRDSRESMEQRESATHSRT
jgi:hypothetical protein